MPSAVVKCDCPRCSCEVQGPAAVFRNGQSFCSDACATGHPNHEPCHDGAGACGCTCGSWTNACLRRIWAAVQSIDAQCVWWGYAGTDDSAVRCQLSKVFISGREPPDFVMSPAGQRDVPFFFPLANANSLDEEDRMVLHLKNSFWWFSPKLKHDAIDPHIIPSRLDVGWKVVVLAMENDCIRGYQKRRDGRHFHDAVCARPSELPTVWWESTAQCQHLNTASLFLVHTFALTCGWNVLHRFRRIYESFFRLFVMTVQSIFACCFGVSLHWLELLNDFCDDWNAS